LSNYSRRKYYYTPKNATHSLRRTIKEEKPTGALQKNKQPKVLMHASITQKEK